MIEIKFSCQIVSHYIYQLAIKAVSHALKFLYLVASFMLVLGYMDRPDPLV